MITTIELRLTSIINDSFVITLDKTEILNFSTEGISVSSIDYFDIEGRRCSVTCDLTNQLKLYLIDNYFDEVNTTRSLSDKNYYFGFYATLIIDNEIKFYGAIPKDSIDASKVNQTISFDIDDFIGILDKVKYTDTLSSYMSIISTGEWIDILIDNLRNNALAFPIPNAITFINNWRQTTERETEGNISADYYHSDIGTEYTSEEYEGETYLTRIYRAKFRLTEEINSIVSEFHEVRLFGSVFYFEEHGWGYQIPIRKWTKSETFDGIIVQNVEHEDNVFVNYISIHGGYEEEPEWWSKSEAYSKLEERLNEEYNNYITNELYWDSIPSLTIVDPVSGEDYTYNYENKKIVYTGIIYINNISFKEEAFVDSNNELISVNLFDVLEQLVFLTNHTIYQKGTNIYIEAKYPNNAEGYNIIETTEQDLLDDLVYKRILYTEIDYENDFSYINIPPVSIDLIEWYYQNLLKYMNQKVSFKLDIGDDNIRPCQEIAISNEGDYIILSIKPDYKNEIIEIEAIRKEL